MARRWIDGRGKRAIDLALCVPLAVVSAPIAAAVAVLIRRRMGSPIMFVQSRAGADGRTIRVSKFRSMVVGFDAAGDALSDEQRITSLGSTLRETSLDEIPQIWSVLRGDMSLVGPRPLPVAYVDRYSTEQRRRLNAKPGITGWAQVNGRNSAAWPERLAMDVWYVDNASLWLDVRILWRTLSTVVRRTGVAADGHATMPEFTGEQ